MQYINIFKITKKHSLNQPKKLNEFTLNSRNKNLIFLNLET